MMTYPNVAKPVIVEMETYSQMAQSNWHGQVRGQ